MNRRARRSFTTGGTMRFRSMRLRRFQFEKSRTRKPLSGWPTTPTAGPRNSMIAAARRCCSRTGREFDTDFTMDRKSINRCPGELSSVAIAISTYSIVASVPTPSLAILTESSSWPTTGFPEVLQIYNPASIRPKTGANSTGLRDFRTSSNPES